MRTGLTLGKYAPFHAGHQLVIETALAEMDCVVVLIYGCPETTDTPLSVRAQWIRDLYPDVEVIEAPDGPTVMGLTPEIKRIQEEYILRRLAGRKIDSFYCSEPYGEHVSQALGASNRIVDLARSSLPISGTELRADPFANRRFLHPRVYRDLVTNVVFLGAPSTGKTTLAQRMAEDFQTAWMPEYGREYWEKHQVDRRLSLEQLAELAEGHLAREDAMLYEANRYLFTDTNAITTYLFSQYYHQSADPRLMALARSVERRYDITIVCGDDIPYDDTWDRSGDANRAEMQARTIEELEQRGIDFHLVIGNLEERMAVVSSVLKSFRKYVPQDRREP